MNAKKAKPESLAAKLSDVGKHAFALAYLSPLERQPELLLLPNIPKPLHEVAPRNVLGINWWNRERKAAYASTLFRCLACGVPKYCASYHQWLEGHEVYDINYEHGISLYLRTVPLCHFCHNYIHDGRLMSLLDAGEIHHAKYAAIIRHGDKVLAEAGLKRLPHHERIMQLSKLPMAKWEDWRMVVDGKSYPPKYATQTEWVLHHNQESE